VNVAITYKSIGISHNTTIGMGRTQKLVEPPLLVGSRMAKFVSLLKLEDGFKIRPGFTVLTQLHGTGNHCQAAAGHVSFDAC